ncbi:hypothetical protein EYC80_000092 [Monilinia laxa]|uniref:VWFA domain-containing protein n=1 Tax=Monilinia laxa TaxID=61186 RepID=A0A5N6K9I0_MONLA|nr:hypothetical protein EYC80_000092 [Monilinia laxa]
MCQDLFASPWAESKTNSWDTRLFTPPPSYSGTQIQIQTNGKDLNRRSGLLGNIRNKMSRSKSSAANNVSSSSYSSSRGVPERQSAPPPEYAATSSASYNNTPTASYSKASPAYGTSPAAYNTGSTSYSNTFDSPCASTVPQAAENAPPHDLDGSPYALLSKFDTVLLIDDSSSMEWYSSPTAWQQVFLALQTIAPIITAYDSDGIDVYFMNYLSKSCGNVNEGVAATGFYKIQDAAAVEEIWSMVDHPSGITPTGGRIRYILAPYMKRLKREMGAGRDVKPLNLIVITDGAASDDPESEIVKVARDLDKLDAPLTQVGIQFFQVGKVASAKQALEDLDDALENRYHIRDMVDTVTWNGRDTQAGLSGDGIVKAVLGAIVKRLDRKPASGEHPRN